MEEHLRILLVDDRDEFRKELSLWLKDSLEHEVEEAGDLDSALELFKRDPERFDAALVDYGLAGNGRVGNGIELMQALHRIKDQLPVIVITGAGDRDISQQALSEKAFWYLEKPLDLVETEKLLDWVNRYRKTGERIEQFMAEQFDESHAVMAISHAIASASEMAEIFTTVKTKALEFFGADLCGLLVVDTETDEVSGLPEDQAQEEEGFLEEMRAIARDLITRRKPSKLRLVGKSKAFKILLACPCPPQEQGVAQESSSEVLFALFRSDLEEKKLETLELKLIALARLVGVALERIRQRRLMEALVKSGEKLLKVSTEEQIFEVVAEQIQKNFNYTAFYLAIYNPITRKIRLPLLFEQGADLRDQAPVLDLDTVSPQESWTVNVIYHNRELVVEDSIRQDLPIRPYPITVTGVVPQSYFGVPLRDRNGSAIGVLSLRSVSTRKFPESAKQALRALATLVAPALDRVHHAEAIERRQMAERHIRELMDRSHLAEVLDKRLREVWPDNPVHIDLLLADRGNRQLIHEGQTELPSIEFGQGLAGLVATTGETHPGEGGELQAEGPPLHPDSQSALHVPIKLGDSLLGVLCIETSEPGFFGGEDRLFLETVAKLLATNLVSAGRKENAEQILRVAAQAAADPDKGLEILTRSAHNLATNVGGAPTSTTVFLLQGNSLELVSAWPPELFNKLYDRVGRFPLESPAGQPRGIVAIAAEGTTKYVPKVKNDPDYIPFDGNTEAELAVPVLAADRSVIGVLNLEYEAPENLTEDDRSLMEALADQGAIVAVLQKLARDLVEKQSQKTTLVMLSVEATDREHAWINEASAFKIELRNFEKIVDLMAKHIGSRAYRALSWIRLAPHIEAGMLESIADALSRSADELKDLGRPEQHIQEKAFIPINSWLRELASYWSQREPSVSFPICCGTPTTDQLHANKYWLNRAMKNLISNAVRVAKVTRGDSPRVELSTSVHGQSVHIEVIDNGPGIPKGVQAYLFKEMIPKGELLAGQHGVGALLTHFIAQEYGGRAFFLPSDEGAKVILELPLAPTPSEGGAQ